MNDAELNAAIAEACGWKRYKSQTEEVLLAKPSPEKERYWIDSGVTICNEPVTDFYDGDLPWMTVPNFCSDLNAMHEARMSLNCLQQNQFTYELMRVMGINSDQIIEACVLFEFSNANARQRAEAFLRTIGKWRGE